jgi:hypothetical protein
MRIEDYLRSKERMSQFEPKQNIWRLLIRRLNQTTKSFNRD